MVLSTRVGINDELRRHFLLRSRSSSLQATLLIPLQWLGSQGGTLSPLTILLRCDPGSLEITTTGHLVNGVFSSVVRFL